MLRVYAQDFYCNAPLVYRSYCKRGVTGLMIMIMITNFDDWRGFSIRLMCITSLQSLSQYHASMRCGRSHIDGYGDDKEKNDDDDDDDYD